jgi:hypothetical protein
MTPMNLRRPGSERAIEMPVEEKQRRFRFLRGNAETNNLDAGSDSFVDTLLKERPLVS